MPQLFSNAPQFDPHVHSIIRMMLGRLRNKRPSQDSKTYVHAANWISDIYEGRATRHQFSDLNAKQYNLDGWSEKLLSCKGDWTKVRQIVSDSITHLDMAKDRSYMPFNKRYLEGITFSQFFECFSRSNSDEVDSPFVKFINEPLHSRSYKTKMLDEKIQEELKPFVLKSAKWFCAFNYKSDTVRQHYFWQNVKEINDWFNVLNDEAPKTYSAFIMACDDANPMQDFMKWALDKYRQRYGNGVTLEPWVFRIHRDDDKEISGDFKDWLEQGKRSGKFAMLREDFKIDGKVDLETGEKEVVDIDDLPIF